MGGASYSNPVLKRIRIAGMARESRSAPSRAGNDSCSQNGPCFPQFLNGKACPGQLSGPADLSPLADADWGGSGPAIVRSRGSAAACRDRQGSADGCALNPANDIKTDKMSARMRSTALIQTVIASTSFATRVFLLQSGHRLGHLNREVLRYLRYMSAK